MISRQKDLILNSHKLFIIFLLLVDYLSYEYFRYELYYDFLSILLFNYIYLLFFLFNFKTANYISILHKAFLLILILPPMLHIAIEVWFHLIPVYAYPSDFRDGNIGKLINFKAYFLSIVFMNFYSLFIKFKAYRYNVLTLIKRKNQSLFYIFVFFALLFAYLSHFNNQVAFTSGTYASGEANFLGINTWNTMSVIMLLYAFNYFDRTSNISKYIFYFSAFYVLFYSSLLFGKRADVIGLFLVLFMLYSMKSIKLNRVLLFILFSMIVFFLMSFTANIRGVGLSDVEFTFSLFNELSNYLNGFRIPSVTDFYGTMPYVISYLDYQDGIHWYGYTYYISLTTLLPGSINPFRIDESATTFLQANYYYFNGGMYFIAELLFNFGEVLLPVFAVFIAIVFNLVSRYYYTNSFFYFSIILIIIDGFPRWLLYGSSSMTKHLFLMYILFYLGIFTYKILLKIIKGRQIENLNY